MLTGVVIIVNVIMDRRRGRANLVELGDMEMLAGVPV